MWEWSLLCRRTVINVRLGFRMLDSRESTDIECSFATKRGIHSTRHSGRECELSSSERYDLPRIGLIYITPNRALYSSKRMTYHYA